MVNLRNLGPGYTLVLINGRRPAQYPQPYNRDNNVVNTRAIPSSVVERVEVLSGGASAIYGSDAVAGVVNIVLRENFDGNQLRVTAGTTTNGGGDTGGFELLGGKTGDRWTATWALQYRATEPVFADQRDFLADTRNGPLGYDFTNPALSLIMIRGLSQRQRPGQPQRLLSGRCGVRRTGLRHPHHCRPRHLLRLVHPVGIAFDLQQAGVLERVRLRHLRRDRHHPAVGQH
ncbi:TonB-dependent receptor plug domain-containing protein [Pseudoxanthomonas sp. NC8]|nr:TonB-dependent receptor plug domain-containing protein [Pseudoxanthomonas sp. NC8]